MFQRCKYYGRMAGVSLQYWMSCHQRMRGVAYISSTTHGIPAHTQPETCSVDTIALLEKYGIKVMNPRPEPQNQVDPNFVKAVKEYIFTENAFFKTREADIRLFYSQLPGNSLATILDATQPISNQFENIMQDAQKVMLRHTCDLICAIPDPIHDQEPAAAIVTGNKKRLAQCEFLLKGDRFARQGYIATGAFLESEAIGEFIHHVFCKSGLVTLEKDQMVPRPLIALTYVMMRHGLKHVENLGAYKRMCKRNSPSHLLYRDILQGRSNERIDWDKIQRVQTEIVHRPPVEFKGIDSYVLEAKESLWFLNYPQFKEFS